MKGKRFTIGLPIVAVFVILSMLLFAVPMASAATLPTVTTQAASGVGANTATLNGTLVSVGDRYVMFQGFKWGTTTGVYNKFWHTGSYWTQRTIGAYTHAPTNFTAGTTYYYVAYCTYRWGSIYGAEQTFTTTGAAASTITTAAVADPAITTALAGGNITAGGGGKVWWRGVEWGIATGVYTDSWTAKKFYGTGYPTGAFTHVIGGLTTATTYYYRAACVTLVPGTVSVSLEGADECTALWSSGQEMPLSPKYLDRSSAELTAAGSGDNGSTHLEFVPLNTVTFADLGAATAASDWSFWHLTPATSADWAAIEFRFTQPGGDADILLDVTVSPMESYTGTAAWLKQTIVQATDGVIYFGNIADGTPYSYTTGGDFSQTTVAGIVAAVEANTVNDLTDEVLEALVLTRVRIELWSATPARICYIDDVSIDGTTYFIEGWAWSYWDEKARNCYAGIWGYGAEVNFTTD